MTLMVQTPTTFRTPLDPGYAIKTDRLSKTYRDAAVLRDVSLAIPRNTICAFLGPNGAGKTTTIRLLLGLSRPSSGHGSIFGLDIERDSLAIRRRVGYLAQDPRFHDDLTAQENLRLTAEIFFSGSRAGIERRIAESLEMVGLARLANRAVKGFSGGERQRLGLAQAQLHHPELLILDEPAAALDPLGRRDVLELIQGLRERTTIFYATHLLDDAQRVSDTAVILNDGALVAQAAIAELLTGDGLTYELVLSGETASAYQRVTAQTWVREVRAFTESGVTQWEVFVRDGAIAQAKLLNLITEDGATTVLSFGTKRQALEDMFVHAITGGK
jgi:ABC-2 type transport system ATP-binding protein